MERDDITPLLRRWGEGDAAASEELARLLYDELRAQAQRYLRRERVDHTLQPTALVHETYLRLVGGTRPEWRDRSHFLAFAARVMRQVLVDHARARGAAKRGGGEATVILVEERDGSEAPILDLLSLDEAMRRLETLEPVQARIIELRYFGGLTLEETARLLDRSVPTVVREARAAKAWLLAQLS